MNGLGKELREVLIRQDDLLKKSVESVLKQISTLEEEQGVTRKVSAAQRAGKLESHVDGAQNVEEVAHQQPSLENKLDEILKNQRTFQAAAVKKGGKRFPGKQRPGPKPSDICRACNSHGHWKRNCPSLNEGGAGRRPQVQPYRVRKGSCTHIEAPYHKIKLIQYRPPEHIGEAIMCKEL